MNPWRCAVILTHNRPTLLAQTVHAIGGYQIGGHLPESDSGGEHRAAQVDQIIIIANASPDGAIPPMHPQCDLLVMPIPGQPPNLAKLMNKGLSLARAERPLGCREWFVAMLCDDAPPPALWMDQVVAGIQSSGAILGATHGHHPLTAPLFKDKPDADIYNRMPGHAFVVRETISQQIRADEGLHWWWQDTDLDWQARLNGGMILCPGPVVANVLPNDYTNTRPDCADRIHFDGLHFDEKWAAHGGRPW